MKTAEEILSGKGRVRLKSTIAGIGETVYVKWEHVLEAMEEYASQFQSRILQLEAYQRLQTLNASQMIEDNAKLEARIIELEEKKFTFSELEDVVMAFGMHWKNTQLPDGPVRFYFRKWFEGTCKNGVSP